MPPKAKPSKKGNSKTLPSKKAASRKPVVAKGGIKVKKPSGNGNLPVAEELLLQSLGSKVKPNPKPIKRADLEKRIIEFNIKSNGDLSKILTAVNKINPEGLIPITKLPEDLRKSIPSLKPSTKRFHGIKIPLSWFPFPWIKSPCADKFGYMSTAAVRNATKLPFDLGTQVLLGALGEMMGDPGRETAPDSNIPAGFTYAGQFIDHDITFDVSSNIETSTDANSINNMRSPALDLDSLYGRGPALDPFLYSFPSTGPATAIRFQLGTNTNVGPGGPGGTAGFGGMVVQTDFDVPRMHNPLNPGASTNTAIIGDPRNDENLIVVQFHQSMLRFHNAVVDLLVLAGFTGDIFTEAKKIVTQHYQWAVVNDFLKRICGNTAINNALSIPVAVNSSFRMPVEFAVAAYRFGHSMIRNDYWINFNFINASLGQVFQFNRNPNLPILSNWVVDFNAFFDTGVPVPVNNKARKIDSVLANGLESIPGGSGIMAILATRNLRRGLAFGLPSGQGMAGAFGIVPMTAAQLKQGLPANEIALLDSAGGILLQKTPLWYYVLREAAVLGNGNQMGPVGARIIADTFIRILKRDPNSYLNVAGGFTPMLPSKTAGDFTFADLVILAGVTQP
ncbi:MAG TPA: heme peroxidase family protein [Chitinophagaceae bacterium]